MDFQPAFFLDDFGYQMGMTSVLRVKRVPFSSNPTSIAKCVLKSLAYLLLRKEKSKRVFLYARNDLLVDVFTTTCSFELNSMDSVTNKIDV